MADIFQTSVSGLLAFQRALATTSHNISNVNTPGYSRQRTEFGTLTPTLAGGGWIGSGVGVETIRRLSDENRTQVVRSNTAEFSRLSAFSGLNARIDNMMADADAGLAPALQAFFGAVHQAASDPSSRTARQLVITEGENLATRVGYFDARLRELGTEVNNRIETTVEEINQFADNIALLNKEIAVAAGRSQGAPPNDLLDQRDELLRQMAERVGVQVVPAEGYNVNVFIGNGQTLVAGQHVNHLTTTIDADGNKQVALVSGSGTPVEITRNITGGSLSGLLNFREESLASVREDLTALVEVLTREFNAQHQSGVTSDGTATTAGQPFFAYDASAPMGTFRVAISEPDQVAWANPAVVGERLVNGQATNQGSGRISNPVVEGVDLSTFSTLPPPPGHRIELRFNGATSEFAIWHDGADTGTTVAYDPANPAPLAIPVAGGGTITVDMTGAPANGDAFTINPNVNGAGDGSNLAKLADLASRRWAAHPLDPTAPHLSDSTFQEFYSATVGRVGTQTLRANVNRDAQEVLLDQAIAARNEVSGVNLEEEAADMLRFQQAFQASAQLITVANSLFQSLLGAVGGR